MAFPVDRWTLFLSQPMICVNLMISDLIEINGIETRSML